MKVCIIGAGPAGLTAAYEISKHLKKEVSELIIYEASPHVGGLSRSIELWDRKVDIGPHRFFTKDRKVYGFWKKFSGETEIVNRETRIFYNSRFLSYPIKPMQIFKVFGWLKSIQILKSFLLARVSMSFEKSEENLENWLIRNFGKVLYQLFFKDYSEKLWGLPCTEIDNKFAKQRIKGIDFLALLKNAIQPKKNNTKSLIDSFEYPKNGSGVVYENLKKEIELNGGQVILNCPVEGIETNKSDKTITICTKDEKFVANFVISTMPISILLKNLKNCTPNILKLSSKLQFRNTVMVYFKVTKPSIFRDQWIYIQDSGLTIGRITNFNNWHENLHSATTTILCAEFWCNTEDAIWKAKQEELAELAQKEICSLGLLVAEDIKDSHCIKIPNSYPVYFKGFEAIVKDIQNYIDEIPQLKAIGRYGAYKYNNQDHSILMGLLVARNLLNNENHKLWNVNSDYQQYFEE